MRTQSITAKMIFLSWFSCRPFNEQSEWIVVRHATHLNIRQLRRPILCFHNLESLFIGSIRMALAVPSCFLMDGAVWLISAVHSIAFYLFIWYFLYLSNISIISKTPQYTLYIQYFQ